MRHLIALLLLAVGIVCLAFATTAHLAQTGYQCTYDCSNQCHNYDPCYPATTHCNFDNEVRYYMTPDDRLFGGCVTGGTACSANNYICDNDGYTDSQCTLSCCDVGGLVYFCLCS